MKSKKSKIILEIDDIPACSNNGCELINSFIENPEPSKEDIEKVLCEIEDGDYLVSLNNELDVLENEIIILKKYYRKTIKECFRKKKILLFHKSQIFDFNIIYPYYKEYNNTNNLILDVIED